MNTACVYYFPDAREVIKRIDTIRQLNVKISIFVLHAERFGDACFLIKQNEFFYRVNIFLSNGNMVETIFTS